MDFSSITSSLKDKFTSISAFNIPKDEGNDMGSKRTETKDEKDSSSPIFLTPRMPNSDTPTFQLSNSKENIILDEVVEDNKAIDDSIEHPSIHSYPNITPYISDLKPVLQSAISKDSKKYLKGRSVTFLNTDVSVFTKMFGCGCSGVLSDDAESSPTSNEDMLGGSLEEERIVANGCFNIPAEEYLLQSEKWLEEKSLATKTQIMEMHAKMSDMFELIQDRCKDITDIQKNMIRTRLESLYTDVSMKVFSYSIEAFAMLPYSSMNEVYDASLLFCKDAGEALNNAVSEFVRSVYRQILILDIPTKAEKQQALISGKIASMAMIVRDIMQEHIVDEAKRILVVSAKSISEHQAYLTKRAATVASNACELISDSLSPTKVRKIFDDCIDTVMEAVCDRLEEVWGRGKLTFDKLMKDLKISLEEFVINSPESLHRSPRDFSLVRYED